MAQVKVLKFGGTSMGSGKALEQVISILKKPQKDARVAAVVVSAMSGVTDTLVTIASLASKKDLRYQKLLSSLKERHVKAVTELVSEKNRKGAITVIERTLRFLNEAVAGMALVRDSSPQTLDYLMSYGERLSAHLLTEVLNDRGIRAEYLNARKLVTTDDNFGSAHVDFKVTNRKIANYFTKHKKLQVVTGFIGATPERKTTTLGRGGSDYSGAIFGAALKAKVIEIWTDVSGLYSADPRLVKDAKVVPELAFEEAGELAYFGAKVLHPKTILPAMRENIPVKILNTFKPEDKGTTIVSDFVSRSRKSRTVEALTFKRGVIVIDIQSPELFDANGLMARIFEIFDTRRTSIDVVATSVTGVSLTIDTDTELSSIVRELSKFGNVSVERGKAILCAVGGSVNIARVAGKMFTLLEKSKIAVELISQAASGISMTFVIKEKDAEKALKLLHKEYIG